MERDESWDEIDDPEEVVLSIRGTVVTTSRIQVIDEASGNIHDVRSELIEPNQPKPDDQ